MSVYFDFYCILGCLLPKLVFVHHNVQIILSLGSITNLKLTGNLEEVQFSPLRGFTASFGPPYLCSYL